MVWCEKVEISVALIEKYMAERRKNTGACNTDKTNTFACDMKVKTRGILLALTGCGVIVRVNFKYTRSLKRFIYVNIQSVS